MEYYDDLISPDWIKYLRDVMPDECKEAIDNNTGEVGKNDKLGWFILKDSKIIWAEKQQKPNLPQDQDIDYDSESDDYACPECGGDCYYIFPFKQCKNCKEMFEIESNKKII